MTTPLRIVFAGTPEFAGAHLDQLLQGPHQVVACYTQPDRRAGRGKKLKPSPVKERALAHDIPVHQPESLKEPREQTILADYNADLMVVVAYGLLLPQAVLDTPRLGCINVHASLLPRWRGAAPIQRAIEAGDQRTGVTIMRMAAGLDTGDMLVKVECNIAPDETSASLHDKLIVTGTQALERALTELAEGRAQPEPQDDTQANYARKITKAEAQLDWQQSARALERAVRAFNPFPVSFTGPATDPDTRVRVWAASVAYGQGTPGEILSAGDEGIEVACGEGSLILERLQMPGKRAIDAGELLRGKADLFAPGQHFANPEATS